MGKDVLQRRLPVSNQLCTNTGMLHRLEDLENTTEDDKERLLTSFE